MKTQNNDRNLTTPPGGPLSRLVWLIAGVGIGAVAGILLAPQSGEDTRDWISTKCKSGMQNMNSNFVASIALQNTTQAASMLGKTVTGTVNNVSTTGLVQGVDFSSGTPMLVVLPTSATSTVEMSLSSVSEMSL